MHSISHLRTLAQEALSNLCSCQVLGYYQNHQIAILTVILLKAILCSASVTKHNTQEDDFYLLVGIQSP